MASNQPFVNKTSEFLYKLCKITFLCGMPNFWIENLYMSPKFIAFYRYFSRVVGYTVYVFLCVEMAAFFTDQNLTEKQESDLLIFGISHPMLWIYTIILSKQTVKIHKILFDIMELTKVFNDEGVERSMMRKSKMFSAMFVSSCMLSMAMYTVDAALQTLLKGNCDEIKIFIGSTYTTIITAWPDVENNSVTANVARVVWNFLWWAMVVRALSVYTFVICLTTSLSHQFMNLQQYFYSLDDIFNRKPYNQREMEREFVRRFKVGIEFFNGTMQVVNLSKDICGRVLSGQIIFNILLVVICMSQLLGSDRTFINTAAIALSTTGILLATGLFMCNAGDITVERPVVIRGLGIMKLSYQSFMSLVKSTYSLFTLIY